MNKKNVCSRLFDNIQKNHGNDDGVMLDKGAAS